MRGVRVAVGVVVAALALAACGSGGGRSTSDATTATTVRGVTTTVDGAGLEVGREYVEAIAEDGGPDTEAMAALSAPGSVAEDYAVHLGAVADVQRAAGEPLDQGEVTVDGDQVFLRLEGTGGVIVDTRWSDFTLDEDGRLVDFTIDDEPLDDRLVVDGATDTAEGVTAWVVSAFQLVSNDSPVVVVEIENGGDARFRLVGADHEAPDGRAFTTSPSGGGLVVPRGATNRAVLAFATSPFGGTLTLQGVLGGATPVEIELPLTP